MLFLSLLLPLAAASFLRVPEEHLFPRALHPRTASAHRRLVRGWRAPLPAAPGSPLLTPTSFGADPTGKVDASPAFAQLLAALQLRCAGVGRNMSDGIADCGGLVVDLQGGAYLLSQPFALPQYLGNLRMIDGTLRAAPTFPPAEFVLGVGSLPCKPPSGQGSCNENVGLSGLTLDGAHVAAGCLRITATMGATLDSSSAVFGFNETGILLQGGHESMISETWVAAFFWSEREKEKTNTTGILIAGNDHFVSNTIVFSARVGVMLQGAANKLVNVHTWNQATGNGGVGIYNAASQNVFFGCYLDFTDLVLAVAQYISFSGGFFLGNAQLVFAAQKPADAVLGVSLANNVWYDCSLPSLAVNETQGAWTSVRDLDFTGTAFCSAAPQVALPAATLVASGPLAGPTAFDFTSVLLFPHVGIASATVSASGCSGPAAIVSELPSQQLRVTVASGCNRTWVSADQSTRSSWSAIPA